MIRAATGADAPALCTIYNHYIENTVISFEEIALGSDAMAARVEQVQSVGLPWLVAEDDSGRLFGYAYASTWKARAAYRHSVEITVYLDPQATAQGIGSALYHALFAALPKRGVHAAVACIALPNEHSVALHEKFGMRKVAHFNEVGYKFGRWLDVGYWQITLPTSVPAAGQ